MLVPQLNDIISGSFLFALCSEGIPGKMRTVRLILL
jgi:hypothetical protein